MDDKIRTTAEAIEGSALPRRYEVRADTNDVDGDQPVPAGLVQKAAQKSPAQWAYERIVLYIQEFEKHLDQNHEAAMAFTGSETGTLRVEGMGYFDPDIVTFYGSDGTGAKLQLIQHVTQMNVVLRAAPKLPDAPEPTRIGFRLAQDISDD